MPRVPNWNRPGETGRILHLVLRAQQTGNEGTKMITLKQFIIGTVAVYMAALIYMLAIALKTAIHDRKVLRTTQRINGL